MRPSYLFLLFILAIGCKNRDIHTDKQPYSIPQIKESNNKKPVITNVEHYTSDELMAEFAIIDPKELNIDYAISDTLSKPFVVLCMELADDAIGIDYYINNEYKHEFVDRDIVKLISEYIRIPISDTTNTKEYITLSRDNISITLRSESFNKSKHTFQYKDNFLETIDNKRIWGTDGNMPRMQYKSIMISLDSKKIEIPAQAFHNVYEPNLEYTSAYYDEESDILYIESMNGDGAGGYEVMWVIEKGIYKSHSVFHGF